MSFRLFYFLEKLDMYASSYCKLLIFNSLNFLLATFSAKRFIYVYLFTDVK